MYSLEIWEEKRDSSSGNNEQNRDRQSRFPFTLPPTGYSVQDRALFGGRDPDYISPLASGDSESEGDRRNAPQVEPAPVPGPFGDLVRQNVVPASLGILAIPTLSVRVSLKNPLLPRITTVQNSLGRRDKVFFVDVREVFRFRNLPRVCANCRRQQDDDDDDDRYLNPAPGRRRCFRLSCLRR
ncbi:hypothetical protein TNCV_3134851 [Trichonephila clavipes]|nr:hypothetical protein TNCV_3134851 [Trichonephila clavipes]